MPDGNTVVSDSVEYREYEDTLTYYTTSSLKPIVDKWSFEKGIITPEKMQETENKWYDHDRKLMEEEGFVAANTDDIDL